MRERLARLAHAAQVDGGEQDDERRPRARPGTALSSGIAEMMLSTPEATDTATVMT